MTASSPGAFPFSAVVGQEEAKLALLLAAREPLLGGVLLRGDKGSAKTTLARGLAALLAPGAPFVELPLGATEDRVVGSIDLASLLAGGAPAVRPGLLAAAHGGVLYVDEINLLADHLVDTLLDVAASGINRVERDGVAHAHPARFVLIGSMNPEEGELRPQLLDRFGFSVEVHASTDRAERVLAVRRRLDADRSAGDPQLRSIDDSLRRRLAGTGTADVPNSIVELACSVALAVGAEGLRADLMLCRGAAAHAAWNGRPSATEDDLRAVADMVLGHRRRRSPLEPPGISPEELDDAFDQARADDEPPQDGSEHASDPSDPPAQNGDEGGQDRVDEASAPIRPPTIASDRRGDTSGKRGESDGTRGRFVRAEPIATGSSSAPIAVAATAIAVAERRAVEGDAGVTIADLRAAVRSQRTGNLVILCVDASGSMGAEQRMSLAKGAVLGLLTDAYQRRDRVALVTFNGDGAVVSLRPTASIEIAQARLRELPTGGTSPIADGLDAAHRLAVGSTGDQGLQPLIVVITDGRATGASDALQRSRASAARLAEDRVPCVVIDAEAGPTRLGLASELAEQLGAPCLALDSLVDGSLERTIRLRLA